jgi:hypothetical protein
LVLVLLGTILHALAPAPLQLPVLHLQNQLNKILMVYVVFCLALLIAARSNSASQPNPTLRQQQQ